MYKLFGLLIVLSVVLGCSTIDPYKDKLGNYLVEVSPPVQVVKDNKVLPIKITNLDRWDSVFVLTPVKAWVLGEGYESPELSFISIFSPVRIVPKATVSLDVNCNLPKGKWEFWVRVECPSQGFLATNFYTKVRVIN